MMAYFVLITIMAITFDNVKNNKSIQIIGLITIFIFLVIVFNRPYFFRDTRYYETVYNSVEWSSLSSFNLLQREPKTSMEYGFLALMVVFSKLGISFRFFSSLLTMISFVSFYQFAKYIRKKINEETDVTYIYSALVFFAIYLSYFGAFYNFVAIRALLCFSLLLIAAYFAIEKKIFRMIVFFVIAFSIQRFALIGIAPLMILLVWRTKFDKQRFRFVWLILGALIIVSYTFQELVFSRVWERVGYWLGDFYVLNLAKTQNSSITRLIQYVAYWGAGYSIVKKKNHNFLANQLSVIYFASLILCILFSGYMSAYRIVDFLYLFTLPVLYSAYYDWDGNRQFKKIFYIVLCVLFLLVLSKYYINWFSNDIWW